VVLSGSLCFFTSTYISTPVMEMIREHIVCNLQTLKVREVLVSPYQTCGPHYKHQYFIFDKA
jgi:hypothetical protein